MKQQNQHEDGEGAMLAAVAGWRRWLGLVLAMLQQTVSGSVYTFPAFSDCLKARFRFTQTQTDLLLSVISLGLLASLPTGWLMHRAGPRLPALIILVLTVGGYGLLYSSTLTPDFYHTRSSLMCLYFFIAGSGAIMATVTSALTCAPEFPARHRAKVLGVLGGCFNAGPTLGAAVYSACFLNGHVTDEVNQDLRGFFGMSTIAFGVVNGLSLLFTLTRPRPALAGASTSVIVRPVDGGHVQSDHSQVNHLGNASEGAAPCRESTVRKENAHHESLYSAVDQIRNDSSRQEVVCEDVTFPDHTADESTRLLGKPSSVSERKVTKTKPGTLQLVLELLKSTQFHFLAWPYIFTACLQLMLLGNGGSILQSLQLQKYITVFMTVFPLVITFTKPCLGTLSDAIVRTVPRPAVVLVTASLQTAMLVLLFFKGDNLPVMVAAWLALCLANAATWTLTLTMTGEYLGLERWGLAWGLMELGPALGGLLVNKVFGLLYDRQVAAPGVTCLGTRCFSASILLAATLSACAVILLAGLLELRVRHERQLARK